MISIDILHMIGTKFLYSIRNLNVSKWTILAIFHVCSVVVTANHCTF